MLRCGGRAGPHPLVARLQGPRADLWQEEECRGCAGGQVWWCEGRRGWGWSPAAWPWGPPWGLTTPFPPNAPGRPLQQLEGLASPETSLPQARLQTE